MRKMAFSICENKDADQLCSKCAADQRLCFCYIHSTIPLLPNPKLQAFIHLLWMYSPVCVNLVENPEDMFSRDAAQIILSFLLLIKSVSIVNKNKTKKQYTPFVFDGNVGAFLFFFLSTISLPSGHSSMYFFRAILFIHLSSKGAAWSFSMPATIYPA